MQDELKQLRQLLSLDEQAERRRGGAPGVQPAGGSPGAGARSARRPSGWPARCRPARCARRRRTGRRGTPCATRRGFEEWAKEARCWCRCSGSTPQAGESADAQRSGRRTVIAAARGEYRDNVLLQQLTGERAYVDEALEQAGLERLAEQETL